MKATLTISALLMTLVAGCGAPQDNALDGASTTKQNSPTTCSIQTFNGHYLTAVSGGGRTSDVLHTDATHVGSWEKFTLIDLGEGAPLPYGFKTKSGNFLTIVGGGGRINDVVHSNATQVQAWERLVLESVGGGYYGIKTNNGRYLTATGAGGQVNDAIHSDAPVIGNWEKFKFNCGL